jgi:hypothetical protein
MKKYSFLLLLLFVTGQLYSQHWQLATETYQSPNGLLQYQYKYATNGNISKVTYLQDKKLFYTETKFTINKQNQLTGFTRSYANGKTPTESHLFTYSEAGKLATHQSAIIKDGNSKIITDESYEWAADSVIVYRASKEKYYSKTMYLLTEEEDIESVKYLDDKNNPSAEPIRYPKYDSNKNPNTLRGHYVDGKINAAHNYLSMQTTRPAKAKYSYNKEGLPISSTIAFEFAETNQTIIHTAKFSYQLIK